MMPLTLANVGEESIVRKVSGNPEVRKHLEDLGFVAGGDCGIFSGREHHRQGEGIPRGHQRRNGPQNYDLISISDKGRKQA